MTLTLEVSGPEGAALGTARRMVFGSAGGTIGRSAGDATHWMLPDRHVSSTHAVIRFQQGVFTIEDRSRNGTFLNSLENRLTTGERHPLKDGDTILIDPFDIRVSISAEAPRVASDPFGIAPSGSRPPYGEVASDSDPWPPQSPSALLPSESESADGSGMPSGDSVMRGLGLPGQPPQGPKAPTSKDLWGQRPWNDSFSPPAALPPEPEAPPEIPTNWQDEPPSVRPAPPIRREPRAPEAAPAVRSRAPAPPDQGQVREEPRAAERPSVELRPKPPRAPSDVAGAASRAAQVDLEEVFRGAGLDPAAATPEMARAIGEILRVVVQGTMDVLHARRGLKEEFRIEHTVFEPVGRNNPLKFSAGAEDALHNLFVRRSPGYLAPVAAFEDAFDDLRYHQMAMLEGMRVAFEAMLQQFNPEKLEEDFDRQQKKNARLPVPMKPRYWELYGERFRDMVRDADTAFRELFGDEFRTAYREQLSRLKAQSRSGKA